MRRDSWLIAALCLVAAARVWLFAAAFPFFNNVDEQAHFDLVHKYARGFVPRGIALFDAESADLCARYGSPEFVHPPAKFDGAFPPPPAWLADPAERESATASLAKNWLAQPNHESLSPPVYYAVIAGWHRLGRWLGLDDGRALYWIRFLNAPLIALLVALSFLACRQWFPQRPALAPCVAALLAFLPQDAFYALNSDIFAPVLGVAGLLGAVAWYRAERPGSWLGIAAGAAAAATFLVKVSNFAPALVLAALLAARVAQSARAGTLRAIALPAAATALAAALPVLAWFWHNVAICGEITATSPKVASLGWTRKPIGAWLDHPLFSPAGVWTFVDELVPTLWRGEFLWHAERLAVPAIDRWYTFSTIALVALAAFAGWRERASVGLALWLSVLASIASMALLSISFDYGESPYPTREHPYFVSGRLIIAALVPLLILFVLGAQLVLRKPRLVVAFVCAQIALMVSSELWVCAPVFRSSYNWFGLP
jgi:hypothetical protein